MFLDSDLVLNIFYVLDVWLNGVKVLLWNGESLVGY